MSLNINGLSNSYNGINTNSKQYKALKEKGWLSDVIQNEATMSPEERLIYEIFGGRDTIIKNLMKHFDSDGDLLNADGVALGLWGNMRHSIELLCMQQSNRLIQIGNRGKDLTQRFLTMSQENPWRLRLCKRGIGSFEIRLMYPYRVRQFPDSIN